MGQNWMNVSKGNRRRIFSVMAYVEELDVILFDLNMEVVIA
jgi:ABC-type siderophore export system fused ATPase/permease subunit